MELKHPIFPHIRRSGTVLIVPSGIETRLGLYSDHSNYNVLIVPSGIETQKLMQQAWEYEVLIVPSGIETVITNDDDNVI